ncbi:MAG: hypothetical protein JJU29_01240 [Verrucomicrobia bacterium]|nr:hypothetical protein [Verrucomicrobiota bacterium]MCH8510469.1 hypothetical protein [Kiritimatiellia bacterium]
MTICTVSATERPFMLWTPEEAAAIRERIENDPDAKRQLERTLSLSGELNGPVILEDMFRVYVMQDEGVAERELRALRNSMGRKPEPLTWDKDPATLEWNEGMPSAGDRHMRDERTEDALRYDVLYDRLTPGEHESVQKYFKTYIQFHLDGHPPRHPHFQYDRMSWLPNMHWPRPIGTHLQAVALGDEDLIRAMFNAEGGWKWYFDEYLGDQGFYMEEFGKFYSNTGSMIFWCEALENLGLGEMGYGYVSETGITMRSHLRANTLDLSLPAIDWGGGMPTFARLTHGDAKGSPFRDNEAPVQHTVVTGYLPNGSGGTRRVTQPRMNGPMAKMLVDFWFEAGHHRWPEDGYDFFLAALREPGEERFYPTLFFNLKPIDPNEVTPPLPTPSYVAKDRGFAFLRQDHSENYWMGPKPAAALQFSRYYVHYVHDPMTLMAYHAFNAPMVLNAWGTGRGYAGGNAWRDSVRGHSGVVVDNLQAQPVARGDDGTVGHRYRANLENALDVRFVAVRADGTYPGVAHERALVLAEHYMLDVTWLRNEDAETSRRYEWQVLSPMTAKAGEAWTETDALDGIALYEGSRFEDRIRNAPPAPSKVRELSAGEDTWSLRLNYALRSETPEGDAGHGGFVTRGVGMDVHMLGSGDTTVFHGIPPGGPTTAPPSLVLARREAPSTVFTALYAPFEGNEPVVTGFERLAETGEGIAVRVSGTLPDGSDFSDLVLLRYGDDHDEEITLANENGFSARFRDHAVVRLSEDGRPATGELLELMLP